MKKTVLLNSGISTVVAMMGHTQTLTIGDAGLPVPPGVQRIDLAVSAGVPGFLCVLDAVLSELCVQKLILAEEIKSANPRIYEQIKSRLANIPVEFVPHEEFKKLSAGSQAVIRTGETLPYSNIILESGVTF